ncbi:MAG: hypothetical protein PVG25_06155, partial [Anaerolineae bacterium]
MVNVPGKGLRVSLQQTAPRVSMEEPPVPQGDVRQLGLEDLDRLLDLWQRAGLHSLKPQGRDSRAALTRQLAS